MCTSVLLVLQAGTIRFIVAARKSAMSDRIKADGLSMVLLSLVSSAQCQVGLTADTIAARWFVKSEVPSSTWNASRQSMA
jgi:hypothetical protein